jgi:protein-disulfide isomerase
MIPRLFTSYRATFLVVASLALVLLACGPSVTAQNDSTDPKPTDVLIKIGDETVTRSEVEEAAADNLRGVELQRLQCQAQADQQRHQSLEMAVDQIVVNRLSLKAADKEGLGLEEWQTLEQQRQEAKITDEQVNQWFEANKARLQGRTLDQISGQIRTFLAQENASRDLRELAAVEIMLDPMRIEVAAAGPKKGPDSAPVRIVEFSDFQCPYCQRVNPTLDEVTKVYGDQVQIVFRHYPLDNIHGQARKAAEASLCANDQGKFWPFHDLLFAEQQALSVSDLKEKATRLELDAAKFESCLDTGKYADQVEEDLRAGVVAGVTGTPAFFVNGRPASGALAFADMAKIIDEELERLGVDSPNAAAGASGSE